MSDNRLVEFDNRRGANVMTTAVAKSFRLLEALTIAHHRGPSDTWTAARDRAAEAAGIERSYAARIWNRWQSMKDVSGEALMRLSDAYTAQCEHNEKMAALHRQRREELAHGGEADALVGQPGMGMAPVPARPSQTTQAPLSRAG